MSGRLGGGVEVGKGSGLGLLLRLGAQSFFFFLFFLATVVLFPLVMEDLVEAPLVFGFDWLGDFSDGG